MGIIPPDQPGAEERCKCGNKAVVHGYCAACAQALRNNMIASMDEVGRLQIERKQSPRPFRASDRVIGQVEVDGTVRVVYVEVQCPVCHTECARPKVLYSRLGTPRRHTDLYNEYPVLDATRYELVFCKGCGYAALESQFSLLGADEAEQFRSLNQNWDLAYAYDGERTEAMAIMGYRLALYFAGRRLHRTQGLLGRLHLRMAWLHRRAGRSAEERECLTRALAALEKSYSEDRYPADQVMQIQYLIGELNLRLGNLNAAAQWLHRMQSGAVASEGRDKAFLRMARGRLEEVNRIRQAGGDLRDVPWFYD